MPYAFRIRTPASQDRLEQLIEARLQPEANKAEIDARLWDLFGEDWAVMFTDLSGFSRRVQEFGIIHFLQTIYESHRLLVPLIDAHDGILLKLEGDSMLVIFRRPERALACAIAMQQALVPYNRTKPEEEAILLCVGLGYGRILRIGDQDVFGAEVNAASKLGEDTARSGEILATEAVRQAVAEAQVQWQAIDTVPPGAEAAWRIVYPQEPTP
jgi:adenylate cyclase